MAKVAYKAKYESANAQIAELRAMVERLAADKTVSPTVAATQIVKEAVKAKNAKPANEGTADHIVLIDPETGDVPVNGFEGSIKENKHGRNVNFTFIEAPDENGDAKPGKPIPALLQRVHEVNTFRYKGYVSSAKRWFMNETAFEKMVADFKVTVYGR